MFDEWKRAWEQAKSNFERELHGDAELGAAGSQRARMIRKDLANARTLLDRLQADITATTHELKGEDEQVQTCERRAAMADNIGDAETARIARDYGARHAERAGILRRKAEVLRQVSPAEVVAFAGAVLDGRMRVRDCAAAMARVSAA